MRVAVAFDHRGVKLRERVLRSCDEARPRGGRPRRRRRVGAHRLPGQGARDRRGDPLGRRRARRARLRLRGRRGGRRVQAAGIRAAICHDVYSAHQGVEHDDMNVLCLGSEVVGAELAADLVRMFLAARRFDGGERYVRNDLGEDRGLSMEEGDCGDAAESRPEACTRVSPRARPEASGSTISRATCSTRRAGADDGGGRRHRRHLQPDHLPEGDLAGHRLRRPAARAARARAGREGDLRRARRPRHRRGLRPDAQRVGRRQGPARLRLDGGRPDPRLRHRGARSPRRSACTR